MDVLIEEAPHIEISEVCYCSFDISEDFSGKTAVSGTESAVCPFNQSMIFQ
jgi:hypothetical protein